MANTRLIGARASAIKMKRAPFSHHLSPEFSCSNDVDSIRLLGLSAIDYRAGCVQSAREVVPDARSNARTRLYATNAYLGESI